LIGVVGHVHRSWLVTPHLVVGPAAAFALRLRAQAAVPDYAGERSRSFATGATRGVLPTDRVTIASQPITADAIRYAVSRC
jgi:hypothetical protein